MQRMKVWACAGAAALAFSGVALADGTVRFASIGEGYRHWGGVFNFEVVADGPSAGYDGSDWNTHQASLGGGYVTNQWAGEDIESGIGSSFATFCLESGVGLGHLGGYFRGEISTSVDSGYGESSWGGTTHTTLEPETAFLYSSFRSNSLTGVTGWNAADADSRANAVQGAIWLIQQQVDQDFVDNNGDGGEYTASEVALIGELYDYAVANANTTYWASLGNVRVLNLWWGAHQNGGTLSDEESQSILVLIPLPTSAAMGSVCLLGIAGVRCIRRRN